MEHEWIRSTHGHGETMCKRCLITNREYGVLAASGMFDVSCEGVLPVKAKPSPDEVKS